MSINVQTFPEFTNRAFATNSNTFVRVDFEEDATGITVRVSGGARRSAAPLGQEQFAHIIGAVDTVEVGVVFAWEDDPRAAEALKEDNQVFTYDALKSLDLRVGDIVYCPVGIINGPQTRELIGTVVTLVPDPSPCRKRIIEARYED